MNPGTTTRSTARHPIAVVAERTGLSQDVLRVWERRYGVVRPERGPGGQRLYSDADVDRLRLLHEAIRAGRSISRLAELSVEDLAALVAEDAAARERQPAAPVVPSSPETTELVADMLALARALDARALDEALRRAAARLGLAAFLESVAAPLLRKVGDEWHAGRLSPAQEHLVTAVVHDIVVEVMRAFGQRDGAPRLLVATLAGERHVVGAALVGAAAALEGWGVLYLGADLPAADIAQSARAAGVRAVGVSIVYVEDRARVLAELRALRAGLPVGVRLIAGGAGAAALAEELAAMHIEVGSSVPALFESLRRERDAS